MDELDWLTGTVTEIYALDRSAGVGSEGGTGGRVNDVNRRGADRLAQIAMKDHVGGGLGVHPSEIHAEVARSRASYSDDVYYLR